MSLVASVWGSPLGLSPQSGDAEEDCAPRGDGRPPGREQTERTSGTVQSAFVHTVRVREHGQIFNFTSERSSLQCLPEAPSHPAGAAPGDGRGPWLPKHIHACTHVHM